MALIEAKGKGSSSPTWETWVLVGSSVSAGNTTTITVQNSLWSQYPERDLRGLTYGTDWFIVPYRFPAKVPSVPSGSALGSISFKIDSVTQSTTSTRDVITCMYDCMNNSYITMSTTANLYYFRVYKRVA